MEFKCSIVKWENVLAYRFLSCNWIYLFVIHHQFTLGHHLTATTIIFQYKIFLLSNTETLKVVIFYFQEIIIQPIFSSANIQQSPLTVSIETP